MSCALISAYYHSKISYLTPANQPQHFFQGFHSRFLLLAGQSRGQLYLSFVSDAAHTTCRNNRSIANFRLSRNRTAPVSIVIIAIRDYHKVKDSFVEISEAISGIIRASFDLIPDNIVTQKPPLLIGQF